MLIAVAFVVIGISTPSPTTAGMESQLTREVQVRGMTRITRHPFLWGTALWALVHFVINGDAAAAIVFGSLFVLAAVGTTSIDAKRRRAYGEQLGAVRSRDFQRTLRGNRPRDAIDSRLRCARSASCGR